MATRKVSLKVPNAIEVGTADVEFEVREGNTLIGTVTISQGGIDWRAAGKHRTQPATWNQFAELMTAPAGTGSKPAAQKANPVKSAAPAPRRRPSPGKTQPASPQLRATARRRQAQAAPRAGEAPPPSGRAIRAWAADQGLTVSARGALSREIRDSYRSAHE